MDKHLEYILCVAENKSIIKAAEKLYITPSALSKYVQKTEKELNILLFDRTGKQFILTYAGERYLDWLKKIDHLQNQMLTELRDISNSYSGKLRIGFLTNAVNVLIYKVMPIFQQQFPNIELDIYEDSSKNLRQMLENYQIDLAILPDIKLSSAFQTYFLAKDQWVVVLPKKHWAIKYAQNKEGFDYPWIDINILKDEEFVFPLSPAFSERIQHMLSSEYSFEPKITARIGNFGTQLKCIKNGPCITISSDQSVLTNTEEGDVTMLSFGKDPFIQNIIIAVHKDHYLSYSAQSFIQIYKELV